MSQSTILPNLFFFILTDSSSPHPGSLALFPQEPMPAKQMLPGSELSGSFMLLMVTDGLARHVEQR